MKKVISISVSIIVATVLSACAKSGDNDTAGAASVHSGEYFGSFSASVNGLPKTGVLGVKYLFKSNDVSGEFDLDDIEGALGGSKDLDGAISGDQVKYRSVECVGDTLFFDHDLGTGDVTFSGSLCGDLISNGSGTLQKNTP